MDRPARGASVLARDADHLAAAAARLTTLPAGHGQGCHDCLDLFVADAYAAMRGGGAAPDGVPLIGDSMRAARIADAVVASARSQTQTEVTS